MRNPKRFIAAQAARTFALDHLTVIETTPAGLIETAAAAGYPRVCTFVRSIDELGGPGFNLSRQPEGLRAARSALVESGATIDVAYPFTLSRRSGAVECRADLEVAASLGARYANLLVYLREDTAILDQVGAFCEEAVRLGLGVAVEMVPASGIKTLAQAVELVQAVDSPGSVGVNLDVLHLYRSGGAPAAAEPFRKDIVYAQLCDGPLARPEAEWRDEAAAQRAMPGDGAFDLPAFLDLTRDAPASLEVPDAEGLAQGLSAEARAACALQRALDVYKEPIS